MKSNDPNDLWKHRYEALREVYVLRKRYEIISDSNTTSPELYNSSDSHLSDLDLTGNKDFWEPVDPVEFKKMEKKRLHEEDRGLVGQIYAAAKRKKEGDEEKESKINTIKDKPESSSSNNNLKDQIVLLEEQVL